MNRSVAVIAALALAACGRMADGTRKALNKGGEIAGAAATEVVEGVAAGVEKTWSLDIRLSEELKQQGLGLGKVLVDKDSAGTDNVLVLYVTAARDFDGTMSAVAFDKDGLEYGRASAPVKLAAGGADYLTLRFQSRTDLERKSRVELR